jgi:hypothetical protein
MCFSATADVVGGVVVAGVGIDALRHARGSAEHLLASMPLIFAFHQLTEAFVWWHLEGHVSGTVGTAATTVYLVIAFGVLPVLVPLAVGALEPEAARGRVTAFMLLGAAVAGVLLYSLARGPVTTAIEGHHIDYDLDLYRGGVLVTLYVVATCGSLLASHHPHVRWFGALNLLAVGVLVWVDRTALVSLWCGWAAVTSVCIALHLRRTTERRVAVTRVVAAPPSAVTQS